jgi:hypothetical protein
MVYGDSKSVDTAAHLHLIDWYANSSEKLDSAT